MKDWVYLVITAVTVVGMVALPTIFGKTPGQPPVIKGNQVFCSDGYKLERTWRGNLVCRKDKTPNGTMIPHEMERNPAVETAGERFAS